MRVGKIDKGNGSRFTIHCDKESELWSLEVSHILSTMPLDDLAQAFRCHLSQECVASARGLRFMDMRLVLLIVNRPTVRYPHLFLYSFENHHQWKRLIARSLENGTTSVVVEIPFDPRMEESKRDSVANVPEQLTDELRLFKPSEILVRHTTTYQRAYPIYQIGFENRVSRIAGELASQNVYLAGRQGLFYYTDTSGSIETALAAADGIVRDIS